jgi:hypothetical protein
VAEDVGENPAYFYGLLDGGFDDLGEVDGEALAY